MNNKKIYRNLKDYMFNNYFEKLGFVRSGEISEKMEKRITGYSERFVKDLGDGVFDVVDLFGYTDSGLFKLQIAYGLFVPEADSENFSKDEVKYDSTNLKMKGQTGIKVKHINDEYKGAYIINDDNIDGIVADIDQILQTQVIPFYQGIKNREDIIKYMESHGLINVTLAYIYGASGKTDKAAQIFGGILKEAVDEFLGGDIYAKNVVPYYIQKMISLGLPVDKELMDKFVPECKKFLESRSLSMNRIKKIDEPLYDCLTREY